MQENTLHMQDPDQKVVTYKIAEGDIPADVFSREGGFDANDTQAMLDAAQDVFDLTHLKIGQIVRFYFDKDVRDINANEAIFLASIIPSPKRALNSFDSEYKLKPSLEGYYRLLAGRLKIKGLISEEEEMAIKPEVKLGEAAKKLIDSRNIPETF